MRTHNEHWGTMKKAVESPTLRGDYGRDVSYVNRALVAIQQSIARDANLRERWIDLADNTVGNTEHARAVALLFDASAVAGLGQPLVYRFAHSLRVDFLSMLHATRAARQEAARA